MSELQNHILQKLQLRKYLEGYKKKEHVWRNHFGILFTYIFCVCKIILDENKISNPQKSAKNKVKTLLITEASQIVGSKNFKV